MVGLFRSFRASLYVVPSQESVPRRKRAANHSFVFPSYTDHLHWSIQSYDVFFAESAGYLHYSWNCSRQHFRLL